MQKIMTWLTDSFAPKARKFTQNPWVGAVADTFTKALPFILAGSLIFLYGNIRTLLPMLPDLGTVCDFTFGLLGLFTAFLIPYNVMEKTKHRKYQIPAGLLGIAVFMLILRPQFDENWWMFVDFNYYGPTGLFVAIMTGLVTSLVYYLWAKVRFLENSAAVPEFVVEWINNLVPIFFLLCVEAAIINNTSIDLVHVIEKIFAPLASFGQTYPGMVLSQFIPCLLFSLGISAWAFEGINGPIQMAGTTANAALLATGLAATNLNTSEAMSAIGIVNLGGMGATLGLNLLALFLAKSKKLKSLGKVCLGTSIFNINEPIIYGFPIAYNPILMVPFLLCSIIGPTIVYIACRTNLLNVPTLYNYMGITPGPIASVVFSQDWRGIIWWVIALVIYTLVWYPFFKVYDRQCLEEEQSAEEK